MHFYTLSRALATQLGVSANPLRLAQFSYNLVSSIVSSVIPLAIRATQSKNKDTEAVREIVAMLNNRLYQARDAYYSAITLGMVQGCNGISLMLGFSNPWAIWLRKQCESAPIAVQGVYDLVLSLFVDVPFAKCICVDSAREGANFQRYAMDNCYYFAPDHLKPLVLGLIEADFILGDEQAAGGGSSLHSSCVAMVQFAKAGLTDSMKPWFQSQIAAATSMASSIDYLLSFAGGNDAGRYILSLPGIFLVGGLCWGSVESTWKHPQLCPLVP
jgi:hypothetical protein